MDESKTDHRVLLCGDLSIWIEQEAIHLKTVDRHGEPVELSVTEARLLAAQLIGLADKIV